MEARANALRGPLLLLAALMPVAAPAAAPWQLGGHVKYQASYADYRASDVNALFGDDPAQDQSGELRLKAERRAGKWDFSAHYEWLAIAGDTVETGRALAGAGIAPIFGALLPQDERRLFDLTHTLTDDGRRLAVHRLDRLSVGYTSATAVVRAGRQAVSWGNGLAFQVLDFINPFSPVAIDKDYKTGDDMLYAQFVPATGGDVQLMLVPRRDPQRDALAGDASSLAAKLHRRLGAWDVDLLAARHYGENVLGAGFARGVGGALWRLDLSHTRLEDGGEAFSLVTNVDYSWTWSATNYYGYIEYFRSGPGAADPDDYPSPDAALAARLERGELFTLGRDYAALGLQIELTPLFNLFHNLIWNGNDGSGFFQLRGVYDFRQDMQLIAGVNYPYGERGEEFGGVPTPVPGAFAAPARAVFARLAWFF